MKPTHDEQGRALGYRKGNRWVWKASEVKYAPRKREVNGVTGRLTPYTTGKFLRPDVGPRGGKAYKECYRQVWWAEGRFCQIKSVLGEDDKWHREFLPIDHDVYNRYDPSERYTLVGGMPCQADEFGQPC